MHEVPARIAPHLPNGFIEASSGTFTRDFFDVSLERELERSSRYGEPASLGLLQLEPRGGATTLPFEELGKVIRSSIRDVDLAARLEDNLFGLLLVRAAAESARIAVERVLDALTVRFGADLGVWAGVVSWPVDGSDSATLRERARAALHAAREAGPRGVFIFPRRSAAAAGGKARILVVDDDARNVKLLEAMLRPMGYDVLTALNGIEALEGAPRADVILLDVMMPGMDGYEVCRRLKGREDTRYIPVVMITALADLASKVKGIQAGADDFLTKPVVREELLARTRSLVRLHELGRSLVTIESALFSLANAVEAKDTYTLGHTQRVARLAVAVGGAMGLAERDLSALRLGGILHDVGKIGVPESVLNKPGPLNDEEWKLMKVHPELGYRICLPLADSIGSALDVIRHHHEKLDGSSYPDGLRGDDISPSARIMGVVDVYDALVSDRPYRKAMSREEAFALLHREADAGRIDGGVVAALSRVVASESRARRAQEA